MATRRGQAASCVRAAGTCRVVGEGHLAREPAPVEGEPAQVLSVQGDDGQIAVQGLPGWSTNAKPPGAMVQDSAQ